MARTKPRLKIVKGDFPERKEDELVNIEPLRGLGKPKAIKGSVPKRVMRLPSALKVDPSFQRHISGAGKGLITSMVEEWDWDLFSPPCIYVHPETGDECVYDGQHTTIAAASHPDIMEIPCDLHESIEDAIAAADKFVGRNTKRLGVHMLQRYKSSLTARHSWAITLGKMADSIGFHIPFHPTTDPRPDTVLAIKTLRDILELRGELKLSQIMRILVGNAIAPIRDMHIKAVEMLLFSQEYRGLVRQDYLRLIIRSLSNNQVVPKAIADAAMGSMTRHHCLANIYYREYMSKYPNTRVTG